MREPSSPCDAATTTVEFEFVSRHDHRRRRRSTPYGRLPPAHSSSLLAALLPFPVASSAAPVSTPFTVATNDGAVSLLPRVFLLSPSFTCLSPLRKPPSSQRLLLPFPSLSFRLCSSLSLLPIHANPLSLSPKISLTFLSHL